MLIPFIFAKEAHSFTTSLGSSTSTVLGLPDHGDQEDFHVPHPTDLTAGNHHHAKPQVMGVGGEGGTNAGLVNFFFPQDRRHVGIVMGSNPRAH